MRYIRDSRSQFRNSNYRTAYLYILCILIPSAAAYKVVIKSRIEHILFQVELLMLNTRGKFSKPSPPSKSAVIEMELNRIK